MLLQPGRGLHLARGRACSARGEITSRVKQVMRRSLWDISRDSDDDCRRRRRRHECATPAQAHHYCISAYRLLDDAEVKEEQPCPLLDAVGFSSSIIAFSHDRVITADRRMISFMTAFLIIYSADVQWIR